MRAEQLFCIFIVLKPRVKSKIYLRPLVDFKAVVLVFVFVGTCGYSLYGFFMHYKNSSIQII